MNILHISPTYYGPDSVIGGGEKYITYLSKGLKAGAERCGKELVNTLLAFGEQPGSYQINETCTCELIHGKAWDPYSIYLPELLEKIHDSDVVFVHQCLSSIGLFIASHAKLAHKVVIGMDHGGENYFLVSHSPESCAMYDLFLAQSAFASSSFKDTQVKVKVIRGPVDTDYYKPDPSIQKDPHLVVTIGRLLPHKGFERIIQALPSPLKLVIVGTKSDLAYHKYLQKISRSSSRDIQIQENFSDEEVLDLLRKAGLLVHASTHTDCRKKFYIKPELLGLAPLEALSCGTPAFVSSAGSLNELGIIRGCEIFDDNEELSGLLDKYVKSEINFPSANELHQQVVEHFGMEQFGDEFMQELTLLTEEDL